MAHAHPTDRNIYFVPHSSKWPFFGSIALFVTMIGFASWIVLFLTSRFVSVASIGAAIVVPVVSV